MENEKLMRGMMEALWVRILVQAVTPHTPLHPLSLVSERWVHCLAVTVSWFGYAMLVYPVSANWVFQIEMTTA